MNAASISVLIPLYNEDEFIRELLARVVAAPLPAGFRLEIIVTDDCSTDGSAEAVEEFIAAFPDVNIRMLRHPKNRGKGAAIRTALQVATGQYSIIQDADLEYNPNEYQRLLAPLIDGNADVVYGSRFMIAGERRVLYFWHALANHLLTTLGNIAGDLNLTDMETGYKAFRTSFLKTIPMQNDRFGMEPEITVKLARRKARIYETPISYHGRTYEEGKKIGLGDAFEAVWVILRARFTRKLYTDPGYAVLDALSFAPRFNRWMADTIAPYVGATVLEIGAGMGNMTRQLCARRKLYAATDVDPDHVERLRGLFQHRPAVRVSRLDATDPKHFQAHEGKFDTVVCLNVLEHLEDEARVLEGIRTALKPGGRLVLLVPNSPAAFGTLDESLSHYRRYTRERVEDLLATTGFQLERILPFNRISMPAWRFTGQVLKTQTLSRLALRVFNQFVWLWRKIDAWLPWESTSIIAIARRRD